MYQEISVGALSEVPAQVLSFAATAGWTVAGSTITRPGGGLSFLLEGQTGGTNDQLKDLKLSRSDDASRLAYIRAPRLNGAFNAPFVPAATKVHCFAGMAPEPYLAMVVEFGFNSYRHLYLGNLEKLGNYTGGEVIAASNVRAQTAYDQWFDKDCQHLFGANHLNLDTKGRSGGVHIVHADNPNDWRFFWTQPDFFPTAFLTDETVIGGFNDSANDHLMARGKATYAGAAVLTPINLYAIDGAGNTANFRPIGRPAGVRLVRMDGLEPGSQILVGNKTWRVFPEARKSEVKVAPRGTSWSASETSYLIGYAYLESEA